MYEKKITVRKEEEKIEISIPTPKTTKNVVNKSNTEFVQYAFLKESFFSKKQYNEQLLDVTKSSKDQVRRAYVCLILQDEFNTYLIPLKTSIKDQKDDRTLQGTYYEVPSSNRPDAGLDFRKIILVNDSNDYTIEEAKISYTQKKIIQDNFDDIKKEAIKYIEGFKTAAKKKRIERERKFRFAALTNFIDELKIK